MASKRPLTPQPSSSEQLLIAAEAFAHLPLDATKEDVEVSFDLVRSLLLDVMVGSLDAHPYKPSWNTLTTYADAELQELMDMSMSAGSPEYSDKLNRVKRLVQSAVDLLP
jgi:hypothetical protein